MFAISAASSAFAQAPSPVALRIGSFNLVGAGCPARESTQLMINDSAGKPTLRIQFSDPAAASQSGGFRVMGPSNQTACTVSVQLTAGNGLGTVEFAVASAVAKVRFLNPTNQGQLTLSSGIRVNDKTSATKVTRVTGTAQASATQAQTREITISDFNVMSEIKGAINLMANLQLRAQGAGGDAVLNLDSVDLLMNVREDLGG